MAPSFSPASSLFSNVCHPDRTELACLRPIHEAEGSAFVLPFRSAFVGAVFRDGPLGVRLVPSKIEGRFDAAFGTRPHQSDNLTDAPFEAVRIELKTPQGGRSK